MGLIHYADQRSLCDVWETGYPVSRDAASLKSERTQGSCGTTASDADSATLDVDGRNNDDDCDDGDLDDNMQSNGLSRSRFDAVATAAAIGTNYRCGS